jgi:hypothetical protein
MSKGCPPRWSGGCADRRTTTGTNISHCTACHETFSGATYFDTHRFYNKCKKPGLMKDKNGDPVFKLDDRGIWIGAKEDPRYTRKAAA